jgi:glucose/mannose transport system permease protein
LQVSVRHISKSGLHIDNFVAGNQPLAPNLRNSLMMVIIWQFTQAWNEFLFAVILTNQSHWPVTVALNNLAGSQLVQWNVLMAATLLAALPTLLVYIFLGRYFLR